VDASGNVFMTDGFNDRVQKFDNNGTFLSKWGTTGSGDGQFNHPQGVAVDSSGNVYVTDTACCGGNTRIQKFDNSGTFLAKWGSEGSGDGQFNGPIGIAADGSGNIFVADTNNNRIQKFTDTGTFLMKWGTAGSADGQFNVPIALAVDASGNVYVSDKNNSRIQKFTGNGVFLLKWGSFGSGDGQFGGQFGLPISPAGLAVDPSSQNVFAVDPGNDRIQEFTSTGTFVTKWGCSGPGNGQFEGPTKIAIDGNGHRFVTDQFNIQVSKFACP
jgi:DNA-binding beta-propeller fold protein YncE